MKQRLFLTVAALFVAAVVSFAQETRDITTRVSLIRNGTAVVYQRYDVTVTKGTEWYNPISNLNGRHIRDLRVFESNEEYENDGRSWNSDRSLEAKTHRCGIIDKGSSGVELCWGQGPYGDHVYEIIYVIDNLVQAMDDDCDAFIWQFMNDEWAVKPQHAKLTVINETERDPWFYESADSCNVRAWGFGFEGELYFEDGKVVYESTEPFSYKSSMIVMMRFDKGLFNPSTSSGQTFAEMQDRAFEGSTYGDDDDDEGWFNLETLFALLCFLALPIIGIAYCIHRLYMRITGKRYRKDIFGVKKIDGWSRDVPLNGDLTATYSLLMNGDRLSSADKEFANLVGAYFLKWVQEGIIKVVSGQGKSGVILSFTETLSEDFSDPTEARIYRSAREAAGANLLLEPGEFKKWSVKHYKAVTSWPSSAKSEGRNAWMALSREDRQNTVRFKNFLEDFTLVDERDVPEVGLWKQYLIFAEVFGVAEKVSKSLEKLFPKIYEEYARQTNMLDSQTMYYVLRSITNNSSSMMSAALNKKASVEAAQRARSSGGGGRSSFGGGGGFSGGGHGGGSR